MNAIVKEETQVKGYDKVFAAGLFRLAERWLPLRLVQEAVFMMEVF
jgi:hypothetical protein